MGTNVKEERGSNHQDQRSIPQLEGQKQKEEKEEEMIYPNNLNSLLNVKNILLQFASMKEVK